MNAPSPVAVVPYDPSHQAGVIAVILPIQQDEFEIPITFEQQPDLRDIAGFYQHDAGNFWVALADGNVVGTLALLDIGHGQAALRKMFVAAPYRGRQHGVAAQLLETLLMWCKQQRLHTLFLGTTAKFLAAHRFYEKHGFRELTQRELPPAFPVMAVDTKFYTRPLS